MKSRRAGWALAVLALLWLATALGLPFVGAHDFSLAEIFAGDTTASTIVGQLRVPRVLLGLLAGWVLAVSGAAFQGLFRNPLAEPYTLGVAGGAALGAVLAIRFGAPSEGIVGLTLVAAASFAGALAATLLVVGLGAGPRGLEGAGLLLAGVAVSCSTGALILFVQYLADSTQTFRMVRWMMGGLAIVGYREVFWLLPWVLLGTGVLVARRWELNLLLVGDELAASRGVDLARLRAEVLVAASLMVGAMVAVTGPIGFVGLMVPHALRRWTGPDHLTFLPACALGGGIFLAVADAGARTALAPAELPVGVLTAMLGGPFFFALLVARRRGGSRG